ncbi:hypothetical protein JB92DRAFT_2834302 [Gautieria morchelliformis]|nr:hypothetical protein JB92DRAFT_2834302 [Gautieria morchelliformis]
MSNSRDYYSSSSSRNNGTHDRHLPPIRDVVGDELDRRNPFALHDGEHRGPTLPPIQQGMHVASNSRATAYPRETGSVNRRQSEYPAGLPPQRQREGRQASTRPPPTQTQEYAYGVLRTSGTGSSLVHAIPPASRAQGILRQGGGPPSYDDDPDKRYKCDYCGKKFDRPSSLQVHVRTHTGSQPFTCEWPGCERSFSVKSNMLRHWRSHERSDASHYEDEIDEDDSPAKPPSTVQQSKSSYYTSFRRR